MTCVGGKLTTLCAAHAMSPTTTTTTMRLVLVALLPLAAAAALAANISVTAPSAIPVAAVTGVIQACRKGGGGAGGGGVGGKPGNSMWGVFDAHLHLTTRTPSQSGAALLAELEEARVDGGLLYSVYGPGGGLQGGRAG